MPTKEEEKLRKELTECRRELRESNHKNCELLKRIDKQKEKITTLRQENELHERIKKNGKFSDPLNSLSPDINIRI
jgi:septal ring factor EnvC (AmiA/AmiB activator)